MFLTENNWQSLIKFAERDGYIDYEFMFDIYKGRLMNIIKHPANTQ